MTLYFVLEIYDDVTQWRINHEAMEARASGPQFLGQKSAPHSDSVQIFEVINLYNQPFGRRQRWCYTYRRKAKIDSNLCSSMPIKMTKHDWMC